MTLWALLRRNLAARRRFVLALLMASAAISLMVTALYPSIGVAYDDVLKDAPPALAAVLGDADFGTPEGFLQVELFSFVGPGIAIAAGVSLAAHSLAGAEEDGRLTLIVASPVTRTQIVSAAALASAVAIGVVTTGLAIGIFAGALLADVSIPASHVVGACAATGLLAGAVAAVALAAGAASGRRGITVGFGAGVAIASYVVDAFFPLSDALESWSWVSLWHPYAASQPIVHGADLVDLATLGAATAAVLVVAYWAFDRRDLRV